MNNSIIAKYYRNNIVDLLISSNRVYTLFTFQMKLLTD